ncbi:681_t:CDS:2, partial [Funneliformis geosporum]
KSSMVDMDANKKDENGGSIYHPETGEKVGYKLVEKYGIEGINHRELYLGKVEDLVEEMLNFIYLSQHKSKPTKNKKTYSKSVSINLFSSFPNNRLVSKKEKKTVNATFEGIKKNYIFDRGKPIHKIRLNVDN